MCLWSLAGFIMVWALFSSFILCIFRLTHKLQVEGSKRKDPYPNTPTQEQFNFYFVKWMSLVPAITFGQVLESSSSLEKARKVSISWYLQS